MLRVMSREAVNTPVQDVLLDIWRIRTFAGRSKDHRPSNIVCTSEYRMQKTRRQKRDKKKRRQRDSNSRGETPFDF
jgi:hypothetical protein